MNRPARLLRWAWPLALGLALNACEEDTAPLISKMTVTPTCGAIGSETDSQGNPVFEISYFGRATGGNTQSDPTGANAPLEFIWDFGDQSSRTNVVSGTHQYSTAGDYVVTLTVRDEDGDEATRTISVTVGAEGEDVDILQVTAQQRVFQRSAWDPVYQDCANPPGTQRIVDFVFVGWELGFEGSLSTPCEIHGLREQYTWHWDFGDGQVQLHEDTPTNVYAALDQEYTVTLTVTEESTQTSRSTNFTIQTPDQLPDPSEKPTGTTSCGGGG